MEAYVMDAFSARLFRETDPNEKEIRRFMQNFQPLTDAEMQQIAAEFKHSETAFVTRSPDGSVILRYFTPAGEVELCGHATIASFALLRALGRIGDGDITAHTKAADLTIGVRGDTVWMDMAPPHWIRELTEPELPEL